MKVSYPRLQQFPLKLTLSLGLLLIKAHLKILAVCTALLRLVFSLDVNILGNTANSSSAFKKTYLFISLTFDRKIGKTHTGRPKTSRSYVNFDAVSESVGESPGKSIQHCGQELQILRNSLQRKLTEDLHLHAYKVLLTKPTDQEQ